MRTEILIRMEGGTEKGHAAKAMKVAAAMQGVESVTLSGKDKSLLRVVGDGLDCNHLTTRLRRKVGHADVVELRTLHAGAGAYGYGSGSRTGGSLSRDAAAAAAYGNGSRGGGSYYGGYPYSTTTAADSDYYYNGQQQPSFQYSYQPPYRYAAAPAAVHYEYYPAATDPNGCSIM
ncbi:hypothetical protein BDA96_04G207500 [Sorghum bicolor]|uniref:HMA domain-containing protein n=2 Tax=Sorghum bicolor TaxID=4558 RepID=A0A921R5A9_SORBI|nr:uncharacterized protein LOC8070570 [Sorghum bicolor]EES07051.1 hypothetical protein SORBI_3004G195300 [Sorghum bicolor]KAG0533612.1 hypothetical protein BDA96_04G207500 [Sorghum bicolor]|eukprot:XP_002454075.1 uncharacterized protein LOC8070570 [Sorghum bicolor]